MKVVLPEPDAPTTTTTSPRRTVIETPFSTSRGPKDLWTSVASTTISAAFVGRPPTAERSSESVMRSAGAAGAQPLQALHQKPGTTGLALIGLAEAPLDPLLHEAPQGRQRQIVEGDHQIELEDAEGRR